MVLMGYGDYARRYLAESPRTCDAQARYGNARLPSFSAMLSQ